MHQMQVKYIYTKYIILHTYDVHQVILEKKRKYMLSMYKKTYGCA